MENTALTWVAFGVAVASAVLGVINHKRIRSSCCRKEVSASLDIENTTPPAESFPVEKKLAVEIINDGDEKEAESAPSRTRLESNLKDDGGRAEARDHAP
jgi:hypothetical protein